MLENIIKYEKIKELRYLKDRKLAMNTGQEGNKVTLHVKFDSGAAFLYMTPYIKRVVEGLLKEILAKALELEAMEFRNIQNAAKREALEFLAEEIGTDCPFEKEVD